MVEINVCERRLPDHTLPSLYPAPFRGVCRVSESKVATPANSTRPPVRAALLLPVPKTWWQRRPKAYRHPHAAAQNRKFSLLAIVVVILLHLYFLYELTRPAIPRFALPVEIPDDEPVEVEITLIEPSAAPAPPEAQSAEQNAASAAAEPEPVAVQAPTPPPTPAPTPTPVSEPVPSVASAAQAAATPVLASEQSAPAPQPVLSVDPVVVASATEQPILFDETEAAEAVTELPDEQVGAVGGNLPESEDRVAAVRPLAAQPVVAPERIAAAPIALLPSISPPSVANVPSARAVLKPSTEPSVKPDLAVETEQPVLPDARPPRPVVSVAQPLRAQPEVVRPQLDIEPSKPEIATVGVPNASAVPVQRVERVVQTSEPPLELETEKPAIAAPARVVTAARPDLRRRAAAERANRENASAAPAVDRSALTQIDTRGIRAPSQASETGTPSPESANAPTNAQSGPSNSAADTGRIAGSADGIDPFATGPGGRDLLSQARQAASAQVGEQAASAGDRRNAFRRYNDPFAEDYPSRLRGLRMREPQLFADVSKFLVKTFGPAALGFALKVSDEHYDFAGPDLGPLVEQWIQQHHGDLELECKRKASEMSEHVRKLLCETGK